MARSANLTAVIAAVDKVSGPMKRIQRSLRAPVRAFSGLGKSVANAGGHIAGILGPLGALGGALSVAGLVGTINNFARGADEVSKFSRQIGISAEALQELTFAADRQGVSQDLLNTSMIAFTKRLGELKAGTGGLYTLLQKVNPELAKQLASAESTESAFNLMIDSLGRLEGEENKAALAAAAFSRSGVAMVRVAEAGSEGLAALRAEARRLGVVIDNDTAKAAEGFVDSLTNMRASLTGITNVIGASLMPHLQPLIDRFTEWAITNREVIASNVGAFVERLAGALASFDWNALADGLAGFASGIGSVVDFLGGWDVAGVALVALMNGPLIAALASVGSAIVNLGLVLAANPIGLAVLGIAYAAAKLIQHWEPVSAWFSEMWAAVTQIFGGAYDVIAGILTGDMGRIVQGLRDIWDGFRDYWSGLWEGLGAVVREVFSDVSSIVAGATGLFDKVSGFFGGDDEDTNAAGQSPLAAGAADRSLIAQGGKSRVDGDISVRIDGLPRGSTVETSSPTNGPRLNADVGYRTIAGTL
ncbi:hypothetical protein [Hwanghaeella sp.]|uniref:hypothetical protein n=1 Tax=Hwanghaeella sp. TaxID=2605943 RepID=UPI003CCBB322